MAFSGALTLTDLNDFLTPSQACIKPVEQVKSSEEVEEPGAAATKIHVDSSGGYYEVAARKSTQNGTSSGKKLQTAQISLNDCLACSGCITSAESVLITMQSHEEVLSFLGSNPPNSSPEHRIPVLSIAPQSLASLAASISSTSRGPVSLQTILHRVQAFCRSELGFTHVFDTTFARHLALLEHAREFNERKAARSDGATTMPMLASACPGWVCYAEKAHAEMLPFMSNTKSPQQVMGTLVKQWMAQKWCRTPDQVYHVSVMPCYDKKLEASRQDFYNDMYKTRDVDCVITTGELELLMRMKGWDLSARIPGDDRTPSEPPLLPELISHPGTSSGSYLHSLLALVSDAPSNRGRSLSLSTRTVRSADYEEYTLMDDATGAVVFKGAKCYGFRNLQNVVRKVGKESGARGLPGGNVRRRAAAAGTKDQGYDYVEVMACPSGCVNGGGQIRPVKKVTEDVARDPEGYPRDVVSADPGLGAAVDPAAKWGDKEWTRKVEAAYWTPNEESQNTSPLLEPDSLATQILIEMCQPVPGAIDEDVDMDGAKLKQAMTVHDHPWMRTMDDAAENRRREAFRTSYRKVESEVVGLAVKW